MRYAALAALTFLMALTPRSATAQLAIENPSHLQVPEQKASLLLNSACRVVAEKFRISNPSQRLLSLKLVLGSKDEHYTADADKDSYTLFLERWDENKFTIAATNLAIQRFVIHDRLPSLVAEVLQRTAHLAPVAVTDLRKAIARGQYLPAAPGLADPAPSETSACISGVTNAGVRNIPCRTLSNPVPTVSTPGETPR